MQLLRKQLGALIAVLGFALLAFPAVAAAPAGADTFQLLASPFTGGDNTGDGGTGLAADLNYYYVGQSFTATMEIKSGGTDAANIIIDYDDSKTTASALTNGTFYPTWAGQTIGSGQIKQTGFRLSGTSSGTGNFGTFTVTMVEPSAFNYGLGSPAVYEIDEGTIGLTTDSNISLLGADILDDVEDFNFHIWADTVKPFAENPSPGNAVAGVAVESNYTFDLRDTLNGEGDNTGVGTGVNTSEPPGAITFDDGGGAIDYTPYDGFSCSGIWGTNLCGVTVNPPSPLGIPGDLRNFEYDTTYTVTVSDFEDRASAAQDQLGDANGPNTMDPKVWTFTTEPDTDPPFVDAETPVRGSSGNSVSTNVVIDVVDKKSANVSGVGVDAATCSFNISSPTFALTTFAQGDAEVTVAAINYGYRFTIDPATNFGQNETVSVSAFDCEDLEGNVMVTDNWTFSTADTDRPYVDQRVPANDAGAAASDVVTFHVKDDGSGVDLSDVVIYVNGVYYTDGGGADSVTTSGTRITFGSSLDFNGGNYGGDTTGVTGTANDYAFTLDPQSDFVSGESVPVLIYARDLSGNLMERDVYAFTIGVGAAQVCGNSVQEGNEACDDGNTVSGDGCSASCLSAETCGNSIFDAGEQCDDGNLVSGDGCDSACEFEATIVVGGGGGGGTSGGGGAPFPSPMINIGSVRADQIDETSVLVTWSSNLPGTSRVVWDTIGHDTVGSAPNYNYLYSTNEQDDDSLYHSVVVTGLTPGVLYYFRPITVAQGHEVWGTQVRMAPKFATLFLQCVEPESLPLTSEDAPEVYIVELQPGQVSTLPAPDAFSSPAAPVAPTSVITVPVPTATTPSPAETSTESSVPALQIVHIDRDRGVYRFLGASAPNASITLSVRNLSGAEIVHLPFHASEGGEWEALVDESLDTGYYRVIFVDNYGQQEEAIIFVSEEIVVERETISVLQPANLIDRVTRVASSWYAYAALGGFLVLLLVAATLLNYGHRIDKTRRRPAMKELHAHKYVIHASLIAGIALLLMIALGLFLNEKTNVFKGAFDLASAPSDALIVSVEGTIFEPLERVGVVGVDLTVGDTSIRTREGGSFIFDGVNSKEGIRINHPELIRAVSRRIVEAEDLKHPESEKAVSEIIFDVDLLNTLISIVNLESRSRDVEIYEYLETSAKASVSEAEFVSALTHHFGPENIADQRLVIGPATLHSSWNAPVSDIRYEQVVELTVFNGDADASYFFVKTGEDRWELVF